MAAARVAAHPAAGKLRPDAPLYVGFVRCP
jgi:hypothetical protein